MGDKQDWDNVRFWAQRLDEKYPRTDLISLSDQTLSEMLLSLEAAEGMPAVPQEDFYFFSLKSAWAVVQNGVSSGGYSYFNIKAMYLTNVLD